MKKVIILTALFSTLGSFNSYAGLADQMEKHLIQESKYGQTYFDILDDLFTQGELPDIDTIMNKGFSGRCFLSTSPDTPTNSAWLFRRKDNSDVGPISRKEYEVASLWELKKPANYFDGHKPSELPKMIEKLVKGITYSKVVFTDGSILTPSQAQVESQVRVVGDYLVEVGEFYNRQRLRVDYRCYYFDSTKN